jgi:D-amino-acid dehydrogenase
MKNVIIIGGGIIGLNTAFFLNKAGCKVTVIDRGSESDEFSASYGNAGMIAPSHFIPLAAPGIISKGIRWMLDATSPFYIKPRLNWDLINWGIKFMHSATAENVNRSMKYLLDINLASLQLYRDMAEELPFEFDYKPAGLLMLCKTHQAKKEEEKVGLIARSYGLNAQFLDKAEVNQFEPNVHPDVIGAVFYPDDGFLSPRKLMNGLKKYLKSTGVKMIYNTDINDFKVDKGKIISVKSQEKDFKSDEFVITGGVWTMELAKKLKLKLPMQGGKGYNITIENPETNINYPAVLVEVKSAVSPFSNKLRLAGTMEINGYSLSINKKRIDTIIKTASEYYRFKDDSAFKIVEPWAGLRPVTPDGLPYLGRLKGFKNLSVATGHAMMGLSLGPISGKLIAEIIAGVQPAFDLNLMNPERFS